MSEEILGYFVIGKDSVDYLHEVATKAKQKNIFPYWTGAKKEAKRTDGKIIKLILLKQTKKPPRRKEFIGIGVTPEGSHLKTKKEKKLRRGIVSKLDDKAHNLGVVGANPTLAKKEEYDEEDWAFARQQSHEAFKKAFKKQKEKDGETNADIDLL